MLQSFKQRFGLADKTQKEANLANPVTEDTVALSAALEASTVALDASNSKVAELALQLSALSTELQALKDANLAAAEAAKVATAMTREQKLVSMLGTEAAPATLKALESLDDAAFAVVTDAMGAKLEAEKNSPLFSEKGVDAIVVTPPAQNASEDAGKAVLEQLQKLAAGFVAANPN